MEALPMQCNYCLLIYVGFGEFKTWDWQHRPSYTVQCEISCQVQCIVACAVQCAVQYSVDKDRVSVEEERSVVRRVIDQFRAETEPLLISVYLTDSEAG